MRTSARTWLAFACMALALIGLGVLALRLPANSGTGQAARILWGVLPIALAAWQFSYHRIERHRLAVDRFLFWLWNRESEWSLVGEFDVPDLAGAFTTATQAISALAGAVPLASHAGTAVWQVEGSTVRLVGESAAGGVGVIRVEFPPAPRQFRAWPRVIEGVVDVVMTAVQDVVPAGPRKFVATVGFPGVNPYFGVFVAHAPLAAVRRFEIELIEPVQAGGNRVLVRQTTIEIVTSSMSAVRSLSRRYLSLRAVESG